MDTGSLIIIAVLPLAALLFGIQSLDRRRRWKRAAARLRTDAGAPALPSAAETRRSISRFKTAVVRSDMVDFLWERWLRERAESLPPGAD